MSYDAWKGMSPVNCTQHRQTRFWDAVRVPMISRAQDRSTTCDTFVDEAMQQQLQGNCSMHVMSMTVFTQYEYQNTIAFAACAHAGCLPEPPSCSL